MTHYVYVRSEPQLWTTGFYKPNGDWEPDDDFGSPSEAGNRVAFLNGAGSIEKSNEIKVLEEEVKILRGLIKTIDDAGLLATVNKLEEHVILAEQIIAAMVEAVGSASTRARQLARLLDEPMLNDGQEKEEKAEAES
jgi:hypothetical protein